MRRSGRHRPSTTITSRNCIRVKPVPCIGISGFLLFSRGWCLVASTGGMAVPGEWARAWYRQEDAEKPTAGPARWIFRPASDWTGKQRRLAQSVHYQRRALEGASYCDKSVKMGGPPLKYRAHQSRPGLQATCREPRYKAGCEDFLRACKLANTSR